MSFALMGLTNWGPNKLIKYESSPCYDDWKLNLIQTGFIRICKCNDPSCEVQKISIAMIGIAMDVVKILRDEFGAKITLESIFSRDNVLYFISKYTTRVALDKFLVKCNVPRSYTFDNTKNDFTINFFNDHILSKAEALEPKAFKAVKRTGDDPFTSDSTNAATQ